MSERLNCALTEAMLSLIASPENWITIVPCAIPGSTRRICVVRVGIAGCGTAGTFTGRVAAITGRDAASGASRGTPSNIGTPMT